MEDSAEYKFEDVKDIPKKTVSKNSKYDRIIDAFLASDRTKSNVTIPDKKGSYIASQLSKRMVRRATENLDKKIEVTSVNDICYIRKL